MLVAEGQDPSPQLDEIERLAAVTPGAARDGAAGPPRRRGQDVRAPGGARHRRPVSRRSNWTGWSRAARGPPFLLVVAGVTDPQNLGALLRSAAGAGVTGVVLPRHRSAHLSPSVVKVAAGAVEHLVVQRGRAACRRAGRVAPGRGLRRSGWPPTPAAPSTTSTLGDAAGRARGRRARRRGSAPLVRRRCDEVVAIPQRGGVASLNAAAAGTVACFEIARRRAGAPGGS